MKKDFSSKPESFTETWEGQMNWFSWHYYLTAIPSPVFLVTSYKSNGTENAALQSWSTFTATGGEYICLLGSVSKSQHLYQTLKETGCCVLNFPSKDIYEKCLTTIENNDFDKDEITVSGLTAEKAVKVNAPRVKECFLNVECEFLWEHELVPNGQIVTIALKAVHITMDSDHYDEGKLGRYGETGYIYNVHSRQNPDTGDAYPECLGILKIAENRDNK